MNWGDIFNPLLANQWVMAPLALVVLVGGWFLSVALANFTLWLGLKIPLLRRWARHERLRGKGWKRRVQVFLHWIWRIVAATFAWFIADFAPPAHEALRTVWHIVKDTVSTPWAQIGLSLVAVVLASFVLFWAFGVLRRLFRVIDTRIRREAGKHFKALRVQQAQILSAEQVTKVVLMGSRLLRWVANILVLLVYLSSVFAVFPSTRHFVVGVLSALLHAMENALKGFVDYSPNLITLAVIGLVTYFALRVLKFLFAEVTKGTIRIPRFYPEWAHPTYQLVRLLVLALALIMAFPALPGSSSPAFQGVSVFIGVLVSLGSSSAIANAIAGLVLTYTRAFRVGDRVKIADTVGDVLQQGVLVTRVRTIKNVEVTIPNGTVLSGHIINYSSCPPEYPHILNTSITLGYDVPWRHVHTALIRAANATQGILSEPKPYVLQTALDDFYVNYELNAATDQPHQMAVLYSLLHQAIQDSCHGAGIEITSPHYQALRQGDKSTIPVPDEEASL